MNNKFLVTALIAIAPLAVGCSDPCGDLEDQCGDCPGTDLASQTVEAACKIVVNADNDDACDAALDNPGYNCP